MFTKSIYIYKNEKKARVKVKDEQNRIHTVYIEPCYESFMQWGANTDVLWHTVELAEQLVKNDFYIN